MSLAFFVLPDMNTFVPLCLAFTIISLLAGQVAKQGEALKKLEEQIRSE